MRKVTIALEIKYGIVVNILHNALIEGESPYVEFNSLQEAMEYMMDNTLPFRGTKSVHEVIKDKTNLVEYCKDNGIKHTGTIAELREAIKIHEDENLQNSEG